MEFLGVGPMELILILIIALIILGPSDMVKAGRTIGRFLRRVITSPQWATFLQVSKSVRTLPNRLMREAGLEEEVRELRQTQDELRKQVNEIKKIKNPLLASAQEIDDEVRSIGGGLSAWTANPAETASKSGSAGEPAQSTGLSAWTTPPDVPSLSSPSELERDNGPAAIYPPAAPES